MNTYNKLRNEAKTDSRRFGKSIVCRIVYGRLLETAYDLNLVPAGIIINTETGLDPANNKMIVIPVVAYPKVQELFKLYSVELNSSDSVDIEVAARIQKTNDLFITAFKQNMALITLNHNIPDGVRAGLSPESYNILIDSVDVNQAVEGTYVYRNAANIRTTSDIRQR